MLRNRELLENGKLWLGGKSERIPALLRQLEFYGAEERKNNNKAKITLHEGFIVFTPHGWFYDNGYRNYTNLSVPGIPMEAFFPKFSVATELNEKIFRILSREQSLRIQRALFALGFRWQDNPSIIVEGQQEVSGTIDFIAIVSGQMVLPGGNKYHTAYYSFNTYIDNGYKEIFEDQIPNSQHIRIDTETLRSLSNEDVAKRYIDHLGIFLDDRKNSDWSGLGKHVKDMSDLAMSQDLAAYARASLNPSKHSITDKTKTDGIVQATPNPGEGEIRGSAIKVRIETSRTATGKRYFSNGIKAGEVRARTQRGIFDSSF